jgi:hypothetical protein
MAAYERIDDDKRRFRQIREWLLFGDADDLAACLNMLDEAIDGRVVN